MEMYTELLVTEKKTEHFNASHSHLNRNFHSLLDVPSLHFVLQITK